MLRSTKLSLRRGKLRSRFLISMPLALVAVMVAVGPDLRLARQTPGTAPAETTEGKVVGASISHPAVSP